MTLFEQGHFTLHSGGKSWFKINCDSLSDDDIDFFIRVYNNLYKTLFRRIRLCLWNTIWRRSTRCFIEQ